MRGFGRWLLGAIALVGAAVSVPAVSMAQDTSVTPPVSESVDANGIDLISGEWRRNDPQVAIGAGANGLSRSYLGNRLRDNLTGTLNEGGGLYTVSYGGISEEFTLVGANYVPKKGQGSTLGMISTTLYKYTAADGTVVIFDKALAAMVPHVATRGVVVSVTKPTGEALTFAYRQVTIATNTPIGTIMGSRLASVSSNLGYQIHYEYKTNTLDTNNVFWTLSKITAFNTSVDYCNPSADNCTGFSQVWPTVTFSGDNTTFTATDNLNRVTSYGSGVTSPAGRVQTYTSAGGTTRTFNAGSGNWTYSYTDSGNIRTMVVTSPLGHQRTVTSDQTLKLVLSDTNAAGMATSYLYDTSGRITRVTRPEGNYTSYSYDARGNVTEIRQVAKAGSGLADRVTTASYDANCSNPVTCNKPNYVIDPRNARTDFTYDPVHGGTLTVTQAAPAPGAVRPQTRFSYSQIATYAKDGSGSLVQAGSIWMLAQVSTCATQASCTATADEARRVISYTGSPNGLPTSVTDSAGDGSVSLTNSSVYDAVGNIIYQDGPLAGTGDRTMYVYDAARQLIGLIEPERTVGPGQTRHLAQRTTYNGDGQPVLVETGSVTAQTAAAWAAFTPAEELAITYDSAGRKIREALTAGGSIQTVKQYSYDAADRLICTAQRMNPAVFSTLPTSACAQGAAGPNGPDKIIYQTYDSVGRVSTMVAGYGSSTPVTEVAKTYTSNGLVKTLADGRSNLTTYEYDGFDRLKKTRLPLAPNGSQSSTTDYEEFTYDANGNVVSLRMRDAQTVAFTYDALNRQLTAPRGESFVYDSLGRVLSATQGGKTLTWAYDAVGRKVSETGTYGTTSYQYDAGGRRTRMTWADGFYVTYEFDNADGMTAIRENGTTVLATFAYDDLGRRASLTRGNGVTTTYSYDAASRLASLANNLDGAGTAKDLTLNFAYSPDDQIRAMTSSSTAYDWTGTSSSRTYTVNGLNQYATSGGLTLTYDVRGNLASDGVNTYGYDVANNMISASGATMLYDPIGRLAEVRTSGSSATWFRYDNGDLIAEYDSGSTNNGALIRRYVHGPDVDEPLVSYDYSSGVLQRRWLVADQRGSVIALTNDSGGWVSTNSYDEYGIPAAGNAGRFQYTGQLWIPEIGLHYYKARMYSPTLGRFMQTDPIGYADGINWYSYVHNDPINRLDPTGLQDETVPLTVPEVAINAGSRGGGTWYRPECGGGIFLCGIDPSAFGPSFTGVIRAANQSSSVPSWGGAVFRRPTVVCPTGECIFVKSKKFPKKIKTHMEGTFTWGKSYFFKGTNVRDLILYAMQWGTIRANLGADGLTWDITVRYNKVVGLTPGFLGMYEPTYTYTMRVRTTELFQAGLPVIEILSLYPGR